MSKYDASLGNLKDQLTEAKSVLVALPSRLTPDSLAAGLALFLSLKNAGKDVSIVTEGSVQVTHTNLYGVGSITNTLPQTQGGDFTLTLEGVVTEDGTVPDLEKLDYFPEGRDMKLVFKVLPGHSFAPVNVSQGYSSGGFGLIFVIGSQSLESLGGVYQNHTQSFSGVALVNLDTNQNNTQFGSVNVIDPGASSLSEIVAQILVPLSLNLDADSASNLLLGIYNSSANLTQRVNPDTFATLSQLMQVGGQLPGLVQVASQPEPQVVQSPPQPQPVPQQPVQTVNQSAAQDQMSQQYNQQFPPFNQVFGFPVNPEPSQPSDNFTVPPVVTPAGMVVPPPSTDEQVQGEMVSSGNPEVVNPEPDWLTPKIFSGKGPVG